MNAELKDTFGALFRGLETDVSAISQLNDWYISSQQTLTNCLDLTQKLNLTMVSADRLMELAARTTEIIVDEEYLSKVESSLQNIFESDILEFREARNRNWNDAIRVLILAYENIGLVHSFFSKYADQKLSPLQALSLMEARMELNVASEDLALLLQADEDIRISKGEELAGLVTMGGETWIDILASISAHIKLIDSCTSQAKVFASETATLSAAANFAKSKVEFDCAWENVADHQNLNLFNSWTDVARHADEDALIAGNLLEWTSRYVINGASVDEFFMALCKETEAKAILNGISASPDVSRLIGDHFDGVDINLDTLSFTHEWGEAVCKIDLPNEIRSRLLCTDAQKALVESRRIFDAIDNGSTQARSALQKLMEFGSFEWSIWQSSVRKRKDKDLPFEIRLRLEIAQGATDSILQWSKYLSARLQAEERGLTGFVTLLESNKIPSKELVLAFEFAVYQSIGRSTYQNYPELTRFNIKAHENTRAEYQRIDAEVISLTGKEFAYEIDANKDVPMGQRGTTVGEYTEMRLLDREINKQTRHIPIRQLLKRAGKALQELKPCFMMGPMSVAQYLELGVLHFDLVVMDEASQLRPEDALGTIARGSQLIVVGDPKQLPPTNFFNRMMDTGDDEDEDAPAAISGIESILDICQQLFTPVRSLRWHYRSQHESLIAFSNHHFYKNLLVFPSPYAKNRNLGVKYRYIKNGSYKDRQNLPEAQRVVDAILEHMIQHQDESLGVVTLNQTQRELIEELLNKKFKTFREGTDFIGRWEAEGWPFFVKNLENVQGDERDVIFISTTFGKASGTEKVRQNFGPISSPDGWRRLNVLFTRSKRRIELFTSMSPDDIIVDEKTPCGTKALHDYLDYAKRGVLVSTDEKERDPDSDFEVSVANVIRSMGYEVKPQLGVAGFFIDMVVRNPDRPGEFLAAIECDGASYHSGFSVRDRDRIRQEILESLGWRNRIHRIWSTDWFYDPRGASAQLGNFLDERRRISAMEKYIPELENVNYEAEVNERGEQREDSLTYEPIEDDLAEAIALIASNEDFFVELGDRITYCEINDVNEKHTVMIVDSQSNPKMGIINEQTPLAKALLGLSTGEIGNLEVPGQQRRQVKVLKVQRQERIASGNGF